MKKYYILTFVSILLLLAFQAEYIRSMYVEYEDTFIRALDENIYISLDRELHIRAVVRNHGTPQNRNFITYETIDEMPTARRDSLLRIHPLPPRPPKYDIEALRDSGVIRHSAEITDQRTQDYFLDEGYPLNVTILDSLITANSGVRFRHTTLLYNKENELLSQSDNSDIVTYAFRSNRYIIGISGRQQVVVYYDIPLSPFLVNSIWGFAASLLVLLIIVLSLIVQLVIIRRKQERLSHIEQNITGTIHDLKSPLSGLVMTLSAAKKHVQSDEMRRIFSLNQSNVKHLLGTIDALLSVARKANGRLVLQKQVITASQLLESLNIIIQDLDNIYQNKPHTIAIQNNLPEGCSFNAEPIYIENIIRNLIENSLKYSDNNVKVVVYLQDKGDNVIFAVTDTGWGIPKKYLKKLFKSFFRLPQAESAKGYGIGLSYVKYIVREHGGQLHVESREGFGSTFYVTLPKI
jgi:signal transduction histidine kinase